MGISDLGKLFSDGEIIVRQGDVGQHMYVIQEGEVEVFHEREGEEVFLATLKAGEFFGEMAIFEQEVRSATVKARKQARILTIDKRTLLRRFQEDPTLAFNILKVMSRRIRELDSQLTGAKGG